MRLSLSFLALCISALALTAPAARAQTPKAANNWYTDSTDLGFKVQMPDDYQLIPPDPNEGTLIAKYDPKTTKYVLNGSDDSARKALDPKSVANVQPKLRRGFTAAKVEVLMVRATFVADVSAFT